MFKRKWATWVAAILVAAMLAGCGTPTTERAKPDKNLIVNVIDVGQGDAILIQAPGGPVTLIDTGDVPARDKLVKYIKAQGISTIDHFIITHPHADHLGGAAAVLEAFTVKQAYNNGQTATTALFRNYLLALQKKNVPLTVLAAGGQVDIGRGAVLKVLAPDSPPISGTESDANNNSIVVKLVYGSFAMLLTGDAEQESEARMLRKFAADLKSQVLKSPHHGSRTSSSPAFLKAAAPEAVLISLGANNEYHHPHPSTLKKYEGLKLKVYRTDTDGTITVTSDGQTYNIAKEKK